MVMLSEIARISGNLKLTSYQPIVLDLARKGAPSYFARRIERGMRSGVYEYQLRVNANQAVYPNIVTPIAGLVDYYRGKGVEFRPSKSLKRGKYISSIGLLTPFDDPDVVRRLEFIDRIWKFNSDSHFKIVNGIMESVRSELRMGKGMMLGLELCLNEITDNVLNHSLGTGQGAPSGFVMAQVYRKNCNVAISVFDTGVGIYETLKRTRPDISEVEDAIDLALMKGVTSGKGRGNGMWILNQIVCKNGGSLEITTDGVRYKHVHRAEEGEGAPSRSRVSRSIPGTSLVDFQLDTSRPLALAEVLGGFNPVHLWLEDHEDDDDERNARIVIAKESDGYGSRVAAKKMRTLIENIACEKTGLIIVDFTGVEIMSTSFADELVVGLSEQGGLGERIVLMGLTDANERVLSEVLKKPMRVVN